MDWIQVRVGAKLIPDTDQVELWGCDGVWVRHGSEYRKLSPEEFGFKDGRLGVFDFWHRISSYGYMPLRQSNFPVDIFTQAMPIGRYLQNADTTESPATKNKPLRNSVLVQFSGRITDDSSVSPSKGTVPKIKLARHASIRDCNTASPCLTQEIAKIFPEEGDGSCSSPRSFAQEPPSQIPKNICAGLLLPIKNTHSSMCSRDSARRSSLSSIWSYTTDQSPAWPFLSGEDSPCLSDVGILAPSRSFSMADL